MKKLIIAIVCICLAATSCVFLTSCSNAPTIERFDGVDLVDGATVTVSENDKGAKNLTDGKNSVWKATEQGAYLEIDFKEKKDINTLVLEEPTDSVKDFEILYLNDDNTYELIYKQDRIDEYRMCAFEDVQTQKIKVVFKEFDKAVSIRNVQAFFIKNYGGEFVRQSYFSYGIEQNGKTYVQNREDDQDFANKLNVLTDVILIGKVKFNADGTLSVPDGEDNLAEDIRIIRELTNGKVRVHITIMTNVMGSDFKGNNKAMVKIGENYIDNYLNSARYMIAKLNVDGFDFDWEVPQTTREWNAYNKILLESKKVLNGRQLSVALWPYGSLKLSKEVKQSIDRVNMMAYDIFDERFDHSSIYESGLKSIQFCLKNGFTKEQVLLGIPFYGRTADKAPQWPLYDESYGKWGNVKKDYEYTDENGTHKSDIYLNGYAMVRDKMALSMAYDIGGVMIFSLTCDTAPYSYEYSLHRAVENVMKQRCN